MAETPLLRALAGEPWDELLWHALADAREEQGDPSGELLRLHLRVRAEWNHPERELWQDRMGELLLAGVTYNLPRRTNSVGMTFALVPAGRFLMGSPLSEEGRSEDELQHAVELTRSFWVGIHPVTQQQYREVMGENPSCFHPEGEGKDRVKGLNTDRFPVEQVSWDDAVAFCVRLTEREGESSSGMVYRLPSEAEWEYGCRGGAPASWPFHFGPSLSSTQANFDGNYPYPEGAAKGPYLERPSPVGSYPWNGLGMYDCHGNVWEWCSDWYTKGKARKRVQRDPRGPSKGSDRVLRGGSWLNDGRDCRSSDRFRGAPAVRTRGIGFRVALVPSIKEG